MKQYNSQKEQVEDYLGFFLLGLVIGLLFMFFVSVITNVFSWKLVAGLVIFMIINTYLNFRIDKLEK